MRTWGSFLIASSIFPNARITAFEPIPRAANTYSKIFRGNNRVRLHRCAIGSVAHTERLHVSGSDDSSSLLSISPRQVATYPRTTEVARIYVPVCKLSDILSPDDFKAPALLKIDVQGYELEVLKGSAGILDFFDDIYVELSFVELYVGQPLCGEVIAFLADQKFQLAGIFNVVCDARDIPLQADFHFSHRVK